MALAGRGYGSLCAPDSWLGAVRKTRCRLGDQGIGYGLRAAWKTSMAAISFRSGGARWSSVSPASPAVTYTPEHESRGQLQRQLVNGAGLSEFEN